MRPLRILLVASTIVIYVLTVAAIFNQGWLWPVVAFHDLMALNWRSQFDFDFVVHLILFASWVSWREGLTLKGYLFGFLSVFLGGMFTFPYLLFATYRAEGDLKKILLGVHS